LTSKIAWRRVLAFILGALAVPVVLIAIYAGNIFAGMHAAPNPDQNVEHLPVRAPVEIVRDARGIPHIRAGNEHDLFFAQGYVEGSDRLFQLDLLRRFVSGRLAEILGPTALATDERARDVPVREIVARQWAHLDAHRRAVLSAFAEGVNAAMRREPTPVEFRILLYRPEPWSPQDSLVVSMATVLDLIDTWNDIAPRDAATRLHVYDANFPLTDPCFDAPVTQGLARIVPRPHCEPSRAALRDERPPIGSNEWAAGAAHTTTGRALLANDPHLSLRIPGVWYLVDLQAPGYHVAGATLPGAPGVVVGHNEHIAWGATNGTVASLSTFTPPANLNPKYFENETFGVRFGKTERQRYYRAAREFGTTLANGKMVLVRWNFYSNPTSPIVTFDGLDRAGDMTAARNALRAYPGPTQNFVVADTQGNALYHLAGFIPNDPAWARYIHPASDLVRDYQAVPFETLPQVGPSRNAVVWTSNNKMYGPDYPLRLSPTFAGPYRAYRVAQLLHARDRYDVGYFVAMQLDTLSLPERELVHYVPALRGWDGVMAPESRQATQAFALRTLLTEGHNGRLMPLLIASRKDAAKVTLAYNSIARDAAQKWGDAGAVRVLHPLSSLGMSFLNGTLLPGNGDSFTVHVQSKGYSQSFRAVWDVGNWNAGGIVIPQGESGVLASPHYTDGAADWIVGRMIPLPFGDLAVHDAAVDRQTLSP
jgi:penicillin amidase